MAELQDEAELYRVLVNHEEQYAIWPAGRDIPDGWRDTEFRGNKADCVSYVDRTWTDMRPLSLRRSMADRGLN